MQVVEIEATNRCNAHCLHCPRHAIKRPWGTMADETFDRIAAQIATYKQVELISFSGMGEPTLNPSLGRFIAWFSSHGLPTSITTNASTLTAGQVQELLDAGLGQITVSFSGHDAELYAKMTGGQAFEAASARVENLVHMAGDRLQVSANVSVTRQTQPYLAGIRDHLNGLGVQDILFSLCHSRGGYLDNPSVCATPLPPVGEGRCDIFTSTLFVAWDGTVLACCHDLEGIGSLGSLVTDDIHALLQKKRQIAQEGRLFPMCAKCNDLYRYAQDATPDRRPLSEWIFMLFSDRTPGEPDLMKVVRRQEARILELEQLVQAYERGRFIRFMKWLGQIRPVRRTRETRR